MSKKLKSLDDLKNFSFPAETGGFVFSTNENFKLDADTEEIETAAPHLQRLEAHLDKKNRGGKVATLIKGFQGSDEAFKALAKQLKTLCGVGGTAKEGEIIIQGNFRDKIIDFLTKEGYKVKRVGG